MFAEAKDHTIWLPQIFETIDKRTSGGSSGRRSSRGDSEAGDPAAALVWEFQAARFGGGFGPVAQPDRATVS